MIFLRQLFSAHFIGRQFTPGTIWNYSGVHLPSSLHNSIGTFRSDYDYESEYELFNVYPVRMPDCVRLSRQLVLSSKPRSRLDANYEIFNKYRCKGELKGAKAS